MAALIVALAVMAIMMTVAMPVWKQAAQREKEEELVFRGQQYVHALALFARKYANAAPPNINMLVEQRFLRKKYKDPITNDDFQPILFGQNLPGAGAPTSATPGQPATAPSPLQTTGGRQTTPVSGTTPSTGFPGAGGRGAATPGTQGGATAGIIGVTSKSKDKSLRLYNGRNHYNEWAFVYTQQNQAPGAGGAPGTATPGQRGQPGQPGGRGAGPGGRGDGRGRGFGRGLTGPGRGIGGGVNPLPPPQPIFQPGRGRSGG